MTNEQEQQSNTSENAKEINKENYFKSQKIATNDPIPNTPFRIIGNPTQGYALTIGKYILTDAKPTEEEAQKILTTLDWHLLANMVVILIKTYNEINEIDKMDDTIKDLQTTNKNDLQDDLEGRN